MGSQCKSRGAGWGPHHQLPWLWGGTAAFYDGASTVEWFVGLVSMVTLISENHSRARLWFCILIQWMFINIWWPRRQKAAKRGLLWTPSRLLCGHKVSGSEEAFSIAGINASSFPLPFPLCGSRSDVIIHFNVLLIITSGHFANCSAYYWMTLAIWTMMANCIKSSEWWERGKLFKMFDTRQDQEQNWCTSTIYCSLDECDERCLLCSFECTDW